jgi:hypothetical protein
VTAHHLPPAKTGSPYICSWWLLLLKLWTEHYRLLGYAVSKTLTDVLEESAASASHPRIQNLTCICKCSLHNFAFATWLPTTSLVLTVRQHRTSVSPTCRLSSTLEPSLHTLHVTTTHVFSVLFPQSSTNTAFNQSASCHLGDPGWRNPFARST